MGLNPKDEVPGLRVRHTIGRWTGVITRLNPALGGVIEVQPDTAGHPRWFSIAEFDAAPDVPPSEAIRRRYLTDPAFHLLVVYQRQLLTIAAGGDNADQDLKDAAWLAVEIHRERRQDGRGAGLMDTSDDVRGRIQDAQEKRGKDKAAEPEPGG